MVLLGQIIIYIIMACAVIGVIGAIRDEKSGIGKEFIDRSVPSAWDNIHTSLRECSRIHAVYRGVCGVPVRRDLRKAGG